jgi:hypothetical protein
VCDWVLEIAQQQEQPPIWGGGVSDLGLRKPAFWLAYNPLDGTDPGHPAAASTYI